MNIYHYDTDKKKCIITLWQSNKDVIIQTNDISLLEGFPIKKINLAATIEKGKIKYPTAYCILNTPVDTVRERLKHLHERIV